MELLIFVIALCIVALLATRFGFDSRDSAWSKEAELGDHGVSWDGAVYVGTGSLFSPRESLNRSTEMSVFTPAEITYLQSQRLARVATSGPGGQPHVVPVSFRYNAEEDTIDVGGHGFAQRKKYRDVRRNPRVAIVIDDLATVDPWRPRMIEIRGQADILSTGGDAVGPGFDPHIFRIRPRRIVSIGIEGDEPFSSNARSVS